MVTIIQSVSAGTLGRIIDGMKPMLANRCHVNAPGGWVGVFGMSVWNVTYDCILKNNNMKTQICEQFAVKTDALAWDRQARCQSTGPSVNSDQPV
jgi:hypothetical protein